MSPHTVAQVEERHFKDYNRHGKEGGRRQQCAEVMVGKVCVGEKTEG